MKKRVLAAAVCAALTVSLVGCSGRNGTSEPANHASNSTNGTNSSSAASSPPASTASSTPANEMSSSAVVSSAPESSAASSTIESAPESSAPESVPDESKPSVSAKDIDWSAVPEIDENELQYTIHKAGKVNFDNVPKEEREKLKDGCVAIKKYTGDAEYIKIPQTIAGMSNIAVVGVDWGKNAKAIKFPDGISFSVYNAGTGTAPNVTSISLPDTVEYIQGFSGLKAIEEITLPKDLKTVGKTTFFRLEKLKKVTFGEKVESIGVSGFSGCSGLESITLPDSVSSVGSAAFNGCMNVEISFKGKTYDEKNVEELYGKDLSIM